MVSSLPNLAGWYRHTISCCLVIHGYWIAWSLVTKLQYMELNSSASTTSEIYRCIVNLTLQVNIQQRMEHTFSRQHPLLLIRNYQCCIMHTSILQYDLIAYLLNVLTLLQHAHGTILCSYIEEKIVLQIVLCNTDWYIRHTLNTTCLNAFNIYSLFTVTLHEHRTVVCESL